MLLALACSVSLSLSSPNALANRPRAVDVDVIATASAKACPGINQYSETADGIFGIEGVWSDTEIADCSDSGAYARATAGIPQDHGIPNGPWTFDLDAWESQPFAEASGEVFLYDMYTLTTADGSPGASELNTSVVSSISGLDGAQFETGELLVRFAVTAILPDGSIRTLVQIPGFHIMETENGVHEDDFTLSLPPLPSGTRIFARGEHYFASAFGGNDLVRREVEARGTMSLCPTSSGETLAAESGAIGDCGPGNIQLVDVDPVQSVFGASFVVASKPTVLKLDLSSSFITPQEIQVSFRIDQDFTSEVYSERIEVPPNCSKTYFFPHPVGQAACRTSETDESLPAPFAPSGTGIYAVTASATLNAPDAIPSDDSLPTIQRTIVGSSSGFRLAWGRLRCSACKDTNPSPFELFETKRRSDALAVGMLPIGGYSSIDCGEDCITDVVDPCPAGSPPDCEYRLDAQNAYEQVKRISPTVQDFVAFAPPGYFAYRALRTGAGSAVATSFEKTSILEVDYVTGDATGGVHLPLLPHELMHRKNPRYFDNAHDDSGALVAGYWVGCHALGCASHVVPQVAASGAATINQNLMISNFTPDSEPPHVWIAASDYAGVKPGLGQGTDPSDVLLMTGDWTTSGGVSIQSMEELPAGQPDDEADPSSPYHIEMVDDTGNVVLSHPIRAQFDFHLDTFNAPPVLFHDNSIPLMLTLPYPDDVVTVRFRRGGSVDATIDPLSQSLRTVMQHLPATAIDANARRALLDKVDAIERMLAGGKALEGALQKIRNDLRDFVAKQVAPCRDKDFALQEIDLVAARVQQWRLRQQATK